MSQPQAEVDLPKRLVEILDRARAQNGLIVVLTGAGISQESGIPTFRGPEGYWQIGSRNYHPQELATMNAFRRMPDEVWAWYLYRRGVCLRAEPNAAHRALVDLETAIGDRFQLITQNVDGLHPRAGQRRFFAIHGQIDHMRCARECSPDPIPMPEGIEIDWAKGRSLSDHERKLLVCPSCGGRSRPHVLWFDESYDEPRYRFESSLAAAASADLLVIVGTSAATTLPNLVAREAFERGAAIVAVNPEPTPFTELASSAETGFYFEATAVAAVPPIARRLA
jgi:NAD-dependent deacetylase